MNSIRDITPINQSPPYSRPSELFPVHYFQYRELSHPASFFLRCDFVVEQKTAYLFDDESSLSFADSISRISSHSRPCLKAIFKFRDNFFGKLLRIQVTIRHGIPRFSDNVIIDSLVQDLVRENTLWIFTIRSRSLNIIFSLLRVFAPFLYQTKTPCLNQICLQGPLVS